jgi:taurine transport system substrate-binding protein
MKMRAKKTITLVVLALFSVIGIGLSSAVAAEEITVAYFPGWPGTFEVAWAKGWFEKEMGVKINFRGFEYGSLIAAAMSSGEVSMAAALGSTAFISAVSQGASLKMIGISDEQSQAENLVVRKGTGITKPRELIGKKIGTPFGTTSHYKLMGILDTFGIEENQVKIIDMANMDVVAAMKRGDIDAGFAWEPALTEMLKMGHIVVGTDELVRWGYLSYGIIAVTEEFGRKNPQLVTKFLKVWDDSTKYYYKNLDESYDLIAKKAGLTPESTKNIMTKTGYFDKEKSLSPEWMGTKSNPGKIMKNLKEVADFFVKQKSIEKAFDDYSPYVDTTFLEAIK